MKTLFKKSAIAATMISGLIAGTATADTFNASLNLVQPISLTEATQMDLGDVLASDSDTCTITTGGARSGAACFGSGNGTLAAINVAGTDGQQVDIALTAGTSGASELSFAPAMLDNGEGATTLTGVTLQTNHALYLGGTLTVANGALALSNGVNSVEYQVEVTYQ
ncbi:hypothetical protein A3749_04460 [Oleiphilus sp. HI0078]|jgi:hypothetical protein|uniref:DUF4402 domain-containing protein n=1 Tax=Oleiphilus sp. HI0132 TaxID=1822270 RepID=UPI0007C2E29C|nr:DUF4402 domain-containing protein [Oleiphilus sp. HI0132]KZY96031.1 hypothetical protein A3743_04915 [Oleiphilus sp. HI0072]KZZ16670.1 hypothetical protein A3749_04460 [Oleiphilus sp. HI0078]KZZ75586.1 hypothetical protein A3766_16245 [Oleiphilus sp. HI0132]